MEIIVTNARGKVRAHFVGLQAKTFRSQLIRSGKHVVVDGGYELTDDFAFDFNGASFHLDADWLVNVIEAVC